MFCRTCGKEIIDEAVICPYCGCLTGVPQQPPTGYNNGFAENKGVQYNNQYTDQYGNPLNSNNVNNPYSASPNGFSTDEVNVGLVVLSVLFPIVGIILGAVNMSDGKKSGKSYLIAALISWGVLFLIGIILMGVGFALAASGY